MMQGFWLRSVSSNVEDIMKSTTIPFTAGSAHSWQYCESGQTSPQIDGHRCPQFNVSAQRSEHGNRSQGIAHGKGHRPRCGHDQEQSSAQGAQGSWHSLPHFEWMQLTSHGSVQSAHGLSPWHATWQLWLQVVYGLSHRVVHSPCVRSVIRPSILMLHSLQPWLQPCPQ